MKNNKKNLASFICCVLFLITYNSSAMNNQHSNSLVTYNNRQMTSEDCLLNILLEQAEKRTLLEKASRNNITSDENRNTLITQTIDDIVPINAIPLLIEKIPSNIRLKQGKKRTFDEINLKEHDEMNLTLDSSKKPRLEKTNINYNIVSTNVSTDKKPFICTYCGKSFTQKRNLSQHEKTHTGEKSFICTYCDKSFTQQCSLNRHLKIHTGEKPFVCTHDGCGKSFTQKSHLNEHAKTHTGEKPFVCTHDGCNKSFTYKNDLIIHERRHTGEKPFTCAYNDCGKSFAKKAILTRHLKIHAKK